MSGPRLVIGCGITAHARPDATFSAAQRAWHQEWARRNREISARLAAAKRERHDAKVLAALRARPGPRRHSELAAVLGVNHDWLRKHVLPRLERAGLVRRVLVTHPQTGWNLRFDWEAQ